MESLKEIYKIGYGPSSSHTMGPTYACEDFLKVIKKNNIKFKKIKVVLYESLAWTGKGHLTDKAISRTLKDFEHEIIFDFKTRKNHPNTLTFTALDENNNEIFSLTYISIGGGYIKKEGEQSKTLKEVYQFSSFEKTQQLLESTKMDLITFIDSCEDEGLNSYLDKVIDAMVNSIEKGLKTKGEVGFELHVKRVASDVYDEAIHCDDENTKRTLLLTSFAYAASEENASGGIIVTAPTAGSCGVLASLVYYYLKVLNRTREEIRNALKVSGFIGLIIKNEASISGSVAGCQAEIGSASSMGSAFCCYLDNLSMSQIGYASEVSLEHSLGLTCDPVNGYVCIPCIERNAMGALRSYDSYLYAKYISKHRKAFVKFDEVVKVMLETGLSLNSDLKETSRGGIAKICKRKEDID